MPRELRGEERSLQSRLRSEPFPKQPLHEKKFGSLSQRVLEEASLRGRSGDGVLAN